VIAVLTQVCRTPCTVQSGFVSAILRAGFHVELAGGGHYNAKALRSKVDQIQKDVNMPGIGITLNSLYINQRQW
jgi:fatty acid synthase subunit beta